MGLKAILKKNPITYRAACALLRVPEPFLTAAMAICHALRGVDADKVYFSSFNGKLYNENPRYVCEALHEICPDKTLVFRLNRDGMRQPDVPDYVKRVPQYSLRALYHMATARVIVKNAHFKRYMRKFRGQYYIQLWHGDRGLKKIGLDLDPTAVKKYIDRKYMDLGVSGSGFGTRVYLRGGMGYTGEVLECGYPKNDLLIHGSKAAEEKVRRALKLPENTRFLLYAPTFRNKNTGSAMTANFSLKRLRTALEAATGEKWLCLTRGHTLNHGVSADDGLDVSAYPDISELDLVCDMLVTDYSSIAGDYPLLHRPVILYHADRARYAADDRGLVFDPEKSPFRIAHSEQELIRLACAPFDAAKNCDELLAFFETHESGHAARSVAERIRAVLNAH